MKNFHHLKYCLFACFIFKSYVACDAQKLPGKQEASIRAADDLKNRHAKITDDQFQAYNRGVEIYYTIANNDDNIYLTIKASKSSVIEKIVEGGIEFTINDLRKKENENAVSVLFPLMPMNKCVSVLLSAGKHLNAGNYTVHITDPNDPNDSLFKVKMINSINNANLQLAENLKYIKILGIPFVTDTVAGIASNISYYSYLPLRDHYYKIISVSNEDDIRANTRFNDKGECIYELCLPIKYLNTKVADIQRIRYHIMVHGRGEDRRIGDTKWYGPAENWMKPLLYSDMETPTDFWGEYTLAKKP